MKLRKTEVCTEKTFCADLKTNYIRAGHSEPVLIFLLPDALPEVPSSRSVEGFASVPAGVGTAAEGAGCWTEAPASSLAAAPAVPRCSGRPPGLDGTVRCQSDWK